MNHIVKTRSGEKLAPREVKHLILSHTAFRNRTETIMKVSISGNHPFVITLSIHFWLFGSFLFSGSLLPHLEGIIPIFPFVHMLLYSHP